MCVTFELTTGLEFLLLRVFALFGLNGEKFHPIRKTEDDTHVIPNREPMSESLSLFESSRRAFSWGLGNDGSLIEREYHMLIPTVSSAMELDKKLECDITNVVSNYDLDEVLACFNGNTTRQPLNQTRNDRIGICVKRSCKVAYAGKQQPISLQFVCPFHDINGMCAEFSL